MPVFFITLYCHVHYNIIHNSPNMETAEVPISGKMDKENVV